MKFDRLYLIWAILPILPFMLGFATLAVINDVGSGVVGSEVRLGLEEVLNGFGVDDDGAPNEQVFHTDAKNLRFLNELFAYLSVGLFHVIACAGVVVYMLHKLIKMPELVRHRALVVLAISIVILIAVNILARVEAYNGGLRFAYRNVCDVILASGVQMQIMPDGCSAPGISRFAWLAAVPYLFGILAAAFSSAVVCGAVINIEQPAKERAEVVTRAFQATAFVLVTSVMALVLFYKLPLSVISDSTSSDLVTGYATGITMFWGVLFTATLIAIFGPANVMLMSELNQGAGEEAEVDGAKLFIDPRTRKMITNTLLTLSPLLVGSSGSFLETIAGAISGG